MNKTFAKLLAVLLWSSCAYATIPIEISNESADCLEDEPAMDITITIGTEPFNLDPSCKNGFDRSITTKNGLRCTVRSGMCSSDYPKKVLNVTCDDDSKASISIACPTK